MGYLSKPDVDISKDVLRKIYRSPDRETVYKAVMSYFENERFPEVVVDLYTPEEFLEDEITHEQALKDDILDKLTDLREEALRRC